MSEFDVKGYVASLTDEELVGEVLSWEFNKSSTEEELLLAVKKNKLSSFYANNLSVEQREFLKKAIKENSKSPCFIVADVERGPALIPETKPYSTSMMSLAATGDEELAFEIGKYTARLCRSLGIHLPLSPVVDLNRNPNNPVTNTRAASDNPDTVLKSAGAYGRGMQSEGNMLMVLKHFPGDGVDDRNQHFCTTVNSLSKEEWMNSYGRVYRELIKAGAEAIMVAHIALPWYDNTYDECGNTIYLPNHLQSADYPLTTILTPAPLNPIVPPHSSAAQSQSLLHTLTAVLFRQYPSTPAVPGFDATPTLSSPSQQMHDSSPPMA